MAHHRMSLQDICLYIGESEANQKHVGGIFSASYGSGDDYHYLEKLVEQMRSRNSAVAPFNLIVKHFYRIPYGFIQQDTLDMDYHIQLHELTGLDDKEVCNQFVAKLHSQLLDRDKPMWQLHLIYDKQSNNFLIYARVHHIYGDGISMVRWVMMCLTESPCDTPPAFWQQDLSQLQPQLEVWWKRLFKSSWELLTNTKDMMWLALRLFGRASRINRQFMPMPFTNPHTVLTGNMTPGRVLTTTKIPMQELQSTAKCLRATVNELMLTVIDIALHQFLNDHGDHLPKQSLTCLMPISLRRKDDLTSGNKMALSFIELARDEQDPVKRLRQIITSAEVVKETAQQVKPTAFIHFNLIWQVLGFVGEVTRLSNFMRPLSNIIASNVPGPSHDCYFGKSKVNTFFPVSALGPGGGINVTLVSYNGTMDIGFICCNKNVESLAPLAEYTQRAFKLLKQSVHSADTDITLLPKSELFVEQDIGKAEVHEDEHISSANQKIA